MLKRGCFEIEDIERLYLQIIQKTVDSIGLESLADNIVGFFAGLFDAELCTFWRKRESENDEILELCAMKGNKTIPRYNIPTYSLSCTDGIDGVTSWIAIEKKICLANSFYELKYDPAKPWYRTHKGKWDKAQFTDDVQFKNLLGLPVIYNNELIGVLKIESTKKTEGFTIEDKDIAAALVGFIAAVFQTLINRENHDNRKQHALRSLTSSIIRKDPTVFYQELVNKTAELLNADICSLWILDEKTNKLKLGANYGVINKGNIPEYDINWSAKEDKEIEGLTPWVLIRRKQYYCESKDDLQHHPAWKGRWDPNQWEKKEFGCLYAVPLLNIEDKPFGVFKIENQRDKSIFGFGDRATFDLVAEFISLALEFNSRLRADIVYDFFHLLKQPVSNSILVYRDLRGELQRAQPRADKITERLAMLSKNLDTLFVWIQNVYALASSREKLGETVQSIPLISLLNDSKENMLKLYDDFSCDMDEVDSDIYLNLTSLQKKKFAAVLYNLLENSYKYSSKKRRIEIRIQAYRENEQVIIRICDNGRGISQENLNRVFEPYFTVGADEWPQTMGLGLSTVERLLEEFGWEKEIKSELDVGTTFTIKIP